MPADRSGTATGRGSGYGWSRKDLDELKEVYWTEIAPAMRRAGLSPGEERPSYEWLADNGFSGLAYALREQHGLTVGEFFADVVGLPDGSADAPPWGDAPEATETALESYLETLSRRQGLARSTIASRRSRLAKFVRTYRELHGDADVVRRAADADLDAAEYDRVLATFDAVRSDLGTDAAARKYFRTVRKWYEWLQRRNRAVHDPSRAAEEFSFDRDEPDNPALDARQVRAIYEEARSRGDDRESELLALAICGWGLRRNEVARLRASQFVLDDGDPRVAFERRKNGPSTVALLYGVDTLDERLSALADRADWSGYLFPSRRSHGGHVHPNTVTNRFRSLAETAGVRIRGDPPTPQHGRRFWYETYLDAVGDMADALAEIAADQGSTDPEVVRRNYLSEETERQYRREAMRERLSEAFGEPD